MHKLKDLILVVIITVLLIIGACKNKSTVEIEKNIKAWQGKHLKLPKDTLIKNAIGNGLLPLSKKIKILALINGSCEACIEDINFWSKKLNDNDIDTSQVGLIFLCYSSDDFIALEKMKKLINLPYPYFYDRDNYIFSTNKFPLTPLYHTFLLDSADNVIIIGPIRNNKMNTLYQREIDKLILKYNNAFNLK